MKKDLFVKYHFKQTVVMGAVVCIAVFGVALMERGYLSTTAKPLNGEVKGAKIIPRQKNTEQVEKQEILTYQNKVKKMVTEYLSQRSKYTKPHQDWLFLVNKTRRGLLDISVPIEYRDVHLDIINAIDKDKATLKESSPNKLNQAADYWYSVLEKYFWLN